jgi:hypothetical protein
MATPANGPGKKPPQGRATADSAAAAAPAAAADDSASSSPSASPSSSRSESLQSAPKWLGKRVGRFRLQALIGHGSMGRVFRADDATLQRRVALKLISLYDRTGQINPAANRFLTEARAAAGLEHPHIVQVFEAGESGNLCYIAMELLEGGSLRELVDASGPLDIHRACQLTAEAAEALQVAHSAGVIHRDIKPANLMLSRHGRCKVTDFGLARVDDDSIPPAERDQRVGTPLFAAPEVISGTAADERSDIYSLGATLFYLLTGRPPFLAKHKAEAMRAHLEQPVPDIRALRRDIPDGLAVAIERSLDKDPGKRFASAEQFSRVLRVYTIPVAAGAGIAAAPPVGGGNASGSSGVLDRNLPAGASGSLAGSDMWAAMGSQAGASGSLGAGGSWPGDRKRTSQTNRIASIEAAAPPPPPPPPAPPAPTSRRPLVPGGSAPPPPPPSPLPSQPMAIVDQIPVATIVTPPRRIAGIPLAGWIGIGIGAAVAVAAVAWVTMHESTPPANQTASNPTTTTPLPSQSPQLASHVEAVAPAPTPAPAVPAPTPTPPPAAVVATPPPPTPKPNPVTPPAPAAVSSPTSDLPPGVLHPRDFNALKAIASGTDPAHPDNRVVVQGTIIAVDVTNTGKVTHIKFAGVGGTDPFNVAYFQSTGMFDKMHAKFGEDLGAALIGKEVRVVGKLRLYHDSPEMVLDNPDNLKILDQGQ